MQNETKLRRNPEAHASIISRIFFLYIVPFFWKGFRRQIQEDDLFEPLKQQRSQLATERLIKEWLKEKEMCRDSKRKPSLGNAVKRIYFKPVACLGLLLLLEEMIKLLQPLAMGRLIRYFRFDKPLSMQEAYMALIALSLVSVLIPLIHHPYFYELQKKGLELKVAACGMIMQKGLQLSSSALHKTTVGHIVTLMSTDVAKFDMMFIFVHYLWLSPLILVSYTVMLWREIGFSSVVGFGALIVLVPIQGYFSRMMGRCRREIAMRTDKRVSVMNEILNGIRVIKMYAWEEAFANIVDELRQHELKKVRENYIWQSLVLGTFWASGKLIILFAITSYIMAGNQLTAEAIFVSMALYNACRLPVTLFVPFALQFLFEGRVSLRRIETFLQLDENDKFDLSITNEESCKENGRGSFGGDANSMEKIPLNGIEDDTIKTETSGEIKVELDNFSAVWERAEADDSKEQTLAIKNVSLSAKPGQLVAIVGPVGSGKSSLVSSILHETEQVGGTIKVMGRIAYVSQDAWIFNGTIRENILFGKVYEEAKYNDVIRMCAMDKDLKQFSNLDETLVGDRGHSLSGGQKVRIGLARAIYSNADIYLLDDPFSCVDSVVGRFLYEKCVNEFLKDKITILVTHQVQYLQNADVILLMRNGEVILSGNIHEVKHTSIFADILQETTETYSHRESESETPRIHQSSGGAQGLLDEINEILGERDETELTDAFTEDGDDEQKALLENGTSTLSERHPSSPVKTLRETEVLTEKLTSSRKVTKEKNEMNEFDEDRVEGAVSWAVYWKYIRAMGHPAIMMPFLLIFAVFVQVFNNFIDWWMNKWTNAAEKQAVLEMEESLSTNGDSGELTQKWNTTETFIDKLTLGFVNLNLDLGDYQTVFTVMVLALMAASVIRCLWFKLSQVTASRLLHDQMFSAVVRTKILFFDKNPIGRILNRFSKDVGTMDDQVAFTFFDFFAGIMNFLGMILVTILINPAVFIPTLPLALLFFCLRFFYLSTSRDVKRIEATTRSPLYSHISAVMQGLTTVRAFSNERLVLKQFYDRQDVNTSANALTYVTARWFGFTIDCLVAIFIMAVAYAALYSSIVFQSGDVALMLMYAIQLTGSFSWVMRQSAELQNSMISVERISKYAALPIEAAERKGMKPPSNWPSNGHLYFHNVSMRYEENTELVLRNIEADIQPREKIGIVGRTGAGKSSLLRALFRLTEFDGLIMIDGISTKSLILQELRKRISIIPQDPVLFIGSLRKNLDPFVEFTDQQLWSALDQVELKLAISELTDGLETHTQEGGTNFSVGQRQLICLARSLLRNTKIIVIDEATANVDPETDALIQRTIKDRFVNSTVLTIAHRLNTIMDSDRVMVMDNGELVEFDHPYKLLQSDNSVFSRLVSETGTKNAEMLRRQAEKSFEKRNETKEIGE